MTILALTIILICLVIAAADLIAFRKAEVVLEAAGNVQSKDSALCVVTIKNPTFLPIIYKQLRIRVENTYTQERKTTSIRMNVLPKSESVIKLDLSVKRCGKIRCSAVWGWRGRKTAFCNFTILPELFSTHVEYNLHESDIYDSEMYSQFRKGQDYSEIFQVREYVPGDNIKHIHWKLSGKTDDLMVKDASFPLDKSIMIIMDKSIPEGVCPPEWAEVLASIAVSTARSLSDEGMNYQLVWNDPEQNTCEVREIQLESELADSIPALLTGPVAKSGKNCGEVYFQTAHAVRTTHVIYISCGIHAQESGLFGDTRVTDIDARVKDYQAEYREIDLY